MTNAYKTTNNLVQVNNNLYPITHSFIVKEEEELADKFQGDILECYNAFYWGIPLAKTMGTHPIGATSKGEITFAHVGMHYYMESYELGNGYDYYIVYGDSYQWLFRSCIYDDNVAGYPNYLESSGLVIGGLNPSSSLEGYSNPWGQPPTTGFSTISHYGDLNGKSIQHLSFSTPSAIGGRDVYEVIDSSGDYYSYNSISRPRPKDFVFWLYGFSFKSEYWSGNIEGYGKMSGWGAMSSYMNGVTSYDGSFDAMNAVDHNGKPIPKSDDLFSQGQVGMRIISNKYKYAPWERYPNLL